MPIRLLLVVLMAALVCGAAATDRQERVAVVAPAHYEGALMVEEPLEVLAKRASRIVVGKVTEVTAFKEPGTIKTRVKIAVDKDVKGKGGKEITLTLEGGSVGNQKLNVGGVPFFLKNERVLLLLDSSANPKIVGSWQGKYSLAGSQAYTREGKSKSINTVEEELAEALNEAVELPQDSAEVTSLSFTTYCEAWSASDVPGFWDGSAWVPTPHADLAAGFEVNPASPGSGGPTGSNFGRVVYNSWHNWQALTNSHPSFSYIGTTSRNGTNHLDGHNTVAWANLGTGTLGVNYCASAGGVRVDSDTLINNTTFTWDWDESVSGTAYSLLSVLEHELGHGLGLGHSNQTCDGGSSTPLMCPSISNGVRKTIKTDDSNGAASRYAISGSAPGAPGSLTVTAGSGSNTLNWTASSGTPLAYDIERRDSACGGSAAWVSVGTVDSRTYGYNNDGDPIATTAVTSFVDNNFGGGLASGSYCYRIKALGAGGDSAYTQQASGAPSTVSVSPASGSVNAGTAMTLTGVFRHGGGYTNLKRNDLVVATSMGTGLQGCWLIYRADLNRLYLRSDAGSYIDAGVPGGAGTAQNSQCILTASASSASGAGTDLAVEFRVTFKAGFEGSYDLFMQNEDKNTGTWSTATDRGDITVNGVGTPSTVSVSPASGSVNPGTAMTLTGTFRHTGGYTNLKRNDLVVTASMGTGLQGCWLIYRADLNRLYLRSDSGGYLDAGVPGSGTTVQNSQCILNGAASTASGSGNDVVVGFRVTFKAAFAGDWNLFMQNEDKNTGTWSTPTDRGDLTVNSVGDPETVSVVPASGNIDVGTPMTFTATFRHTGSYTNLKRNDLVVTASMGTGLQGCWLIYRADLNRLYLRSDSGGYLDAGVPGSGTTVQNSRCILNGAASTANASGTDISVGFRVTFTAAFAGAWNLFMQNEDKNTGVWSTATDRGDITVE